MPLSLLGLPELRRSFDVIAKTAIILDHRLGIWYWDSTLSRYSFSFAIWYGYHQQSRERFNRQLVTGCQK